MWGNMDISGEAVVKAFTSDAVKVLSATGDFLFSVLRLNSLFLAGPLQALLYCSVIIFGFLSGPQRLIRNDLRANMTDGYLTSKIICLLETLLEYRFCQIRPAHV